MLKRQKLLLYILEKAERSVSAIELTNWAFLLGKETSSCGGSSFYRFVPYRRGPASFCLNHEVNRLVRDGHVTEMQGDRDGGWTVAGGSRCEDGGLSGVVKQDASYVVERFKDTSEDTLLGYVCKRFPWFTVNRTEGNLEKRPVAAPAAYTVGYEGMHVDGLLNLLIHAGIQRVVDVRDNPIARRFGFHKGTLNRLCANVHIEYIHMPELGIPSAYRRELQVEDYGKLFLRYERETITREKAAVDHLAETMAVKPSVLLCMEADSSKCHRSRLAHAIARRSSLAVTHLG